MRALVVIALLALLASGCATRRFVGWQNQTHSDPQRLNVETMQCQQYAAQTAPYRHWATDERSSATAMLFGERRAQFEAAFVECMQRLGYQPMFETSRPSWCGSDMTWDGRNCGTK
jgi:hypothetical protein